MTAMYPSQPYQDLIQSYQLRDVRTFGLKRVQSSPYSILSKIQEENYSIFHHMVSVAKMEELIGSPQFKGTVLLPSDEYITTYFGMDSFMNMDRNTARMFVNYHIFPKIKNLKSLSTRVYSKLDTRNERSEITVTTTNGVISLNGEQAKILGEEFRDNGTILYISGLLIPPEVYSSSYNLSS